MRERRPFAIVGWYHTRITPAYAGKTKSLGITTKAVKDHPRLCGKDFLCFLQHFVELGSPPLMRERLLRFRFLIQVLRITPAYAGKTFNHTKTAWPILGSPPLMRERLDDTGGDGSDLRITPAYAGKTNMSLYLLRLKKDHPRLCGKDLLNVDEPKKLIGSPPLMRERLRLNPYINRSFRITPAYAGKTLYTYRRLHVSRDHPRLCGKDS
ncbi:hypothetical protein TMUPMC115_2560 [Tetragenococcus muriaticus PMC-11-5]|uniref:Uncharacterized protein n=1 Tax=Tetragenococcus muriaticus PMC-11-5 TaxID=1302649 RepID=A0A091CBU2_9ENTE|nr:hypothetical protein TMUPMC115_2560 [Tetragenococcus muriaticus PMC-11-5]